MGRFRKAALGVFLAVSLSAAPAPSASPARVGPITLTVSAAASLADAFTEIKALYLKEHPDRRIALNLGGSGTLAVQILRGAPADVFAAAGPVPMRDLVRHGLVDSAAVRYFAGNRLVLIVPRGSAGLVRSATDLARPEVRRIAMGEERTVPAGHYAAQSLRSYGIYESVRKKVVLCEDVRQVMEYVRTGAADAGFVYASDVVSGDRSGRGGSETGIDSDPEAGAGADSDAAPGSSTGGVRIASVLPDGVHDPILYPIAPLEGSEYPEQAKDFAAFVLGARARGVLRAYGFRAPEPAPPPDPQALPGPGESR